MSETGGASSAPTGRALGVDLGSKRIGVAICDAGRTVATPLETVARVGDRSIEHGRLAQLVDEHEVSLVVVGLPLSLDGGLGPTAKQMLSEVKGLRKRLAVTVITHDERLTTVTAEASLRSGGVSSKRGRSVVDQLAAAVILQSWIDSQPGSQP